MGTVTVWVLLIYMTTNAHGGPAVVDNIKSQAECERVRAEVLKLYHAEKRGTVCLRVDKAPR